jgi:hypothetical protein
VVDGLTEADGSADGAGTLRVGGPGRTGETRGGWIGAVDRDRARPASSASDAVEAAGALLDDAARGGGGAAGQPGMAARADGAAGGPGSAGVAGVVAAGIASSPSTFWPDHSRNAPHEPQNVCSASFCWPHFEQMTLPAMSLPVDRPIGRRPVEGLPLEGSP